MNDRTESIWEEFSGRMRAFIARRVDNEADAEDILQEVFLKVHEHLGAVKRADRIVPWLFQITRNCIIDYYRSPRRKQESPLEIGSDGDVAQRKDRHVRETAADPKKALKELSSCITPLIQKLPPEYREALSLVALQGVPQNVTAKQLGLSVSGMKSRVQRGREKLKALLGRCCHVQMDRRGRIYDYDTKFSTCRTCGPTDQVDCA